MDEINKRVQEDINRILSQVDSEPSSKPQQRAGEIPPTTPEEAEQQPTRLVDIHVYELAPGETIPSGEETPPSDQEQQGTSPPTTPQRQSRRRPVLLCIAGFCILLLVSIVIFGLYPLFTASATVTIIPVTRQISTTDTITVVTGQKATGAQQIAGSTLSSVTMTQVQTASTTGKGHQDAQPGHGMITFYNSAPYEQTITAGTMLTGADGAQIITDQDAYISAAQYPTFGQTTVPAHTVIIGPASNIRAGDIYGPCNCRLNVSAVNSTFTGGRQARDFQTVTQQDIDAAASSLKSSLDQSVQAALKTQVQSDQTLITPVSCQQSITPDHHPGEEATQVQVTISETCTGATYNTQAYQKLVTQYVTQEASRQLGEGYTLTGSIQSSILQATPKDHGTIMLQVKSTGSYVYQFTQEQQQNIKAIIAGKSKDQATSTLLHVPGVQSVSFSLSHDEQLPADAGRIHLTFLVTI